MHRTDVLNWLERLGARQVAINLQDSILPQADLRFLSVRNPEVQVHTFDPRLVVHFQKTRTSYCLFDWDAVHDIMCLVCLVSDQQTAATVVGRDCGIWRT
jgi:hypothetical protein